MIDALCIRQNVFVFNLKVCHDTCAPDGFTAISISVLILYAAAYLAYFLINLSGQPASSSHSLTRPCIGVWPTGRPPATLYSTKSVRLTCCQEKMVLTLSYLRGDL